MRPKLGRAIVGGMVGTAVMTAMMYMVAPMMGVNMDIAAMLGSMIGGWAAGMILHVLNGTVVFPLAYTALVYRMLRGSPLVRGLVFGGILWVLAQTVVMPLMGVGPFSAHAGGMLAAGASLIGHLIYGALLGAVGGAPATAGQPVASTPIYRSRHLREERSRRP